MSKASPYLELKDLTVGYGSIPVLEHADMHVRSGEAVGILGRNGSGKTTLIRTVAGIQKELGGDIRISGDSLIGRSVLWRVKHARLGCLLQHHRNIPNLTIRENLHLALWDISRWAERETKIQHLLSHSPFDQLRRQIDDYAGILSGGQRLLLAIGALLLQDSEVILLDEPSDGLDESNRRLVENIVKDLKNNGKAVVVVEQLLRVLFSVSDRVYLIGTSYKKAEDGQVPFQTLLELASEDTRKVHDIYRQNPVLSPEHFQEIDSVLWQQKYQTNLIS